MAMRNAGVGFMVIALAGVMGCGEGDSPQPAPEAEATAADTAVDTAIVVRETWISPSDTLFDIDTPALWTDGAVGRVLATAKGTHDLKVYDAATGRMLESIGSEGPGPGRFQRPNAVLVEGDLAFVVERDNRRVQVLLMPSGESAGSFGSDVLERPYGAVIAGSLPDLTFWVTDDYEIAPGQTPDYSRRLHRFRVTFAADGTPMVEDHAAFGATTGEGALAVVESIGLDPDAGRVLVADETRRQYLVYDTSGAFVGGPALGAGRIGGDPEGIALVPCEDGRGFWIVTDQQDDVSYFRIFTRRDFTYVGTFRGVTTANTDGVSFVSAGVPGLQGATFLAVHDDQAVSAFAWNDIRGALDLPEGCG